MMHKAWSSIEEMSYCFSRSSVKFQGHMAKTNRRIWPKLDVSGLELKFEIFDGYEMIHRAWSSIVEVPYCFSRSYVKFQGHTALKIIEFDPNWAFPDSNSSLNSPMAMKCCTKLETAKERCPIVFQGHPSNFKVTRDKTSPILTRIGRFRTIGWSQLSNPSDLLCFCWIWMSKSENRIICEIHYFTSQCSVARTFGTRWQHNRTAAMLDLAMTAWRTRPYTLFRHTGINFASGYNGWCNSLWIVKISESSICLPHSSMPMIKYGVCYGSERHGVTNHWKLYCLFSSFCVITGDQCSHSQR